jgi:hypothetical protein
MNDSLKIKANIIRNTLYIQLRGYFMKSELELAFYLARRESKKLTEGYEVILDLDGMHTTKKLYDSISDRTRRMFMTLGASNVKSIGAVPLMQPTTYQSIEYFPFSNVGIYPN